MPEALIVANFNQHFFYYHFFFSDHNLEISYAVKDSVIRFDLPEYLRGY